MKRLNGKKSLEANKLVAEMLTQGSTYEKIRVALAEKYKGYFKQIPYNRIIDCKTKLGLPVNGRKSDKPSPPREWVEAVGLKVPAIRPDNSPSASQGLAKAVKALRQAMIEEGIEELTVRADHILTKTVQEQVLHC